MFDVSVDRLKKMKSIFKEGATVPNISVVLHVLEELALLQEEVTNAHAYAKKINRQVNDNKEYIPEDANVTTLTRSLINLEERGPVIVAKATLLSMSLSIMTIRNDEADVLKVWYNAKELYTAIYDFYYNVRDSWQRAIEINRAIVTKQKLEKQEAKNDQ